MTLATTISAPNLAKIRADASAESQYWAGQYLVAVPDSIVVQFQPSTNLENYYADIVVGSVESGSMSNVKSFQTVIYSTTTDYQTTEYHRTYVRKVSGTSTLYIGGDAFSLRTSNYVTVVNTYDVFNKPRVLRNGVQYADWDVAFRRLLPVESDLPTAIVLTDGITAWSPTANPVEMDNDATSTFTHAWESSNGSDTLDSGGTTNNPSWTLQANAHRWIRYSFTDSNGNANLRVISVWTVPKDLSSQIFLGFIDPSGNVANISYQQTSGWTCDIPSADNNGDIYVSALPKGMLCCVFSIETINATRGSIESNVDFVGYLGNEVTRTEGNPHYGKLSETRFALNSFTSRLQTTPISPVPIYNVTSPTTWDSIENPTPARVITYLLTEYTTLGHLCGVRVPTDHTDFIGDDNVFRSDFNVTIEAVKYQADAMDAIVQYSRDGILDITRNLVQTDSTARDAANTVVAMTPDDWESYEIEVNPDPTLKFMIVGCGVYNTSSDTFSVYIANVPVAPDIRGIDDMQIPNVILTTNATDSEARTEAAQRSANRFAAYNPTDVLRVKLKDAWRFLQPDVGAWYTFTIAEGDTVRGWVYDSSTRWQLLEISYTTNNETGRKEVNAVFRKETENSGANIVVTQPETNAINEINALPAILPPFSGGDLGLTDGLWNDSYDTTPSSFQQPPNVGCEDFGFRPQLTSSVVTDRAALTGESISYTVSGSGKLQDGSEEIDDFSLSDQGWTSVQIGDHYGANDEITSGNGGTHSGAWNHGDVTRLSDGLQARITQIDYDMGSIKRLTSFGVTYNLTKGTFLTPGISPVVVWYTSLDGITWDGITGETASEVGNGSGLTHTWESTSGLSARYLSAFVRSSLHDHSGSCSITQIEYTTVDIYGDALYQWHGDQPPSAYGSDDGFLFEGVQPASIPGYNDSHSYELYDSSVDSGAILLEFQSPYGNSNMDNWGLQGTVCFEGT